MKHYPSVKYKVVCTSHKFIQSVSYGHLGARNDKHIARTDVSVESGTYPSNVHTIYRSNAPWEINGSILGINHKPILMFISCWKMKEFQLDAWHFWNSIKKKAIVDLINEVFLLTYLELVASVPSTNKYPRILSFKSQTNLQRASTFSACQDGRHCGFSIGSRFSWNILNGTSCKIWYPVDHQVWLPALPLPLDLNIISTRSYHSSFLSLR